MIPADRVTVVTNEAGRVEAHVAKVRKPGFYVVDFYPWGDRNCTCWAATTLGKVCEHIEAAKVAVSQAVSS